MFSFIKTKIKIRCALLSLIAEYCGLKTGGSIFRNSPPNSSVSSCESVSKEKCQSCASAAIFVTFHSHVRGFLVDVRNAATSLTFNNQSRQNSPIKRLALRIMLSL